MLPEASAKTLTDSETCVTYDVASILFEDMVRQYVGDPEVEGPAAYHTPRCFGGYCIRVEAIAERLGRPSHVLLKAILALVDQELAVARSCSYHVVDDDLEFIEIGLNDYVEPDNRQGFVYLLHGERTGFCKIGRTKSVTSRISTLQIQLPWRLDLLHIIECADMVSIERDLHERFSNKRANGEWFLLDPEDIAWIKRWSTAGAIAPWLLDVEGVW